MQSSSTRKLKIFLKIFFILLAIQLIVGISDIQLNNADSSLSTVTYLLLTVFSFPLSLISPVLPFYSGEGIFITLMFWGLNLILQTIAIFIGIRIFNKLKKT